MIRIESEQFDALRENINFMLNKAIRDMIETEVLTETVTAKIRITIKNRSVQDTPTESRIAHVPEFKFKVGMNKQVKHEVEGDVYEDQMEIIITDDGEIRYKKMDFGQMSLFDDDPDE